MELMYSRLRRKNCFEALSYTHPLIDNSRNKQKIAATSGLDASGPPRCPSGAVSRLRGLHSAHDGTWACLTNSTLWGCVYERQVFAISLLCLAMLVQLRVDISSRLARETQGLFDRKTGARFDG